jgi:tetratricopeptide (TPR) repeat protein
VKELEKAVMIKPDFAEAHNRLAISYDRLGRFDSAESAYRAALDGNPGIAYLHNNLGYSYLLQGKPEAAIGAFKRAIELNGSEVNRRIYNNLGLAYAMTGRYREATGVFERAFGKAEADYRMACIYDRQGKAEEAKKHYASAAALDPSSPVYRKAFEEREQSQESSEFLKQVRRVVDDASRAAGGAGGAGRERLAATGIEISNGNGVLRMAWKVSRFLKERGFTVVRLTNADSFTCPETVIQYRGGYETASTELAKAMPAMPKMTEIEKLERHSVKIRMLLGRDIVRDRNKFLKGE